MVYFVFDLDLTLADIGNQLYNEIYNLQKMPEEYAAFVQTCAKKETSDDPMGFLRIGLVRSPLLPASFKPYMEQLLSLKQKGICQGVIMYSNNGYLPCLHFVRDVIHTILGVNDLFCHCIHRLYPGRPRGGDPAKTWDELKQIMETNTDPANTCKVENFTPSNVLFFDDRHDHKIRTELGTNYIVVYPYENLYGPGSANTLNTMREATYAAMNKNIDNIQFLLDDSVLIRMYLTKVFQSDTSTIQAAIDRASSLSTSIQGGYKYSYTMKNRLKQKKQQRKHKYSKRHHKQKHLKKN